MIEIKHRTTGEILYSADAESLREAVEKAVKEGINLQWAYLPQASLSESNLSGANLYWVNLRMADLTDSEMSWANLCEANLSMADLQGANLRGADLREAYLDFSCLPLWCGSFGPRVDSRLIRQLAAHICRLECDEPEGQAIQRLLWPVRNAFCRDRDDVKKMEE